MAASKLQQIKQWTAHAECQIEQSERLLQGEKISHPEQVFSLCELHTRWIFQGQGGL